MSNDSASPTIPLRFRLVLGLFISGLVVSGLTAFPLQLETTILHRWFSENEWISRVHSGIVETYSRFPFFAYGTDWLGFGHLVIALFFVLPFADPIRYRGVLKVGLVACAGVIALALICGPIRGIPFSWTLIDCSFGLLGAIPLLYCLRLTRSLQSSPQFDRLNRSSFL